MAEQAKMALVTGASRGIGKAIARGLVEAGLRVIGTSRADEGRASVESIGAEWHSLEVTERGSMGALADDVEALDVLVNNAAIALDGFDAAVVRRTMAVNFLGVMHLTDCLLPKMRADGRVVMISSGLGSLSSLGPRLRARFEDPELDRDGLVTLIQSFEADVESGVHPRHGWPSSAYGVSKAALNALTRILARELEDDPRRIRVNAACPGWVRTDMGGPNAPRSPEEGADTPIWLALSAPASVHGLLCRDRRTISF